MAIVPFKQRQFKVIYIWLEKYLKHIKSTVSRKIIVIKMQKSETDKFVNLKIVN